MSIRKQYRVTLKRRLDNTPNDYWQQFCRFSLDIKEEKEAQRLWDALPLKIGFSVVNESAMKALVNRMERAGIGADFSIVGLQDKQCRRHLHLTADQICPKCQKRPVCTLCAEFEPIKGCAHCIRWTRLRSSFRHFRIAVLLSILIFIVVSTYLKNQRIANWNSTLTVGIFPIYADNSKAVSEYLQDLTSDEFQEIPIFFQRQAKRYDIDFEPLIQVLLGPSLEEKPPKRPHVQAEWYKIMLWTLKFRYWAFCIQRRHDLPSMDIRLFILFYEPRPNKAPDHSLGLKKGHLGLLYLFADPKMNRFNQVLIAHELLHTVGATDKYGQDELPIHPTGFADPYQSPLFPQTRAEIMAGSIPLSKNTKCFPKSLDECVIGPKTAGEISW